MHRYARSRSWSVSCNFARRSFRVLAPIFGASWIFLRNSSPHFSACASLMVPVLTFVGGLCSAPPGMVSVSYPLPWMLCRSLRMLAARKVSVAFLATTGSRHAFLAVSATRIFSSRRYTQCCKPCSGGVINGTARTSSSTLTTRLLSRGWERALASPPGRCMCSE